MIKLIKRLFCGHVFVWNRNVYGDERKDYAALVQSIWECKFCGKQRAWDDLWNENKGNVRV